jgi:hypothetical protein
VSLGELTHDGEAQSASRSNGGLSVHSARERNPDFISCMPGHTRTLIIDCKPDRGTTNNLLLFLRRLESEPSVAFCKRDGNAASCRSILHRVVEKIQGDLSKCFTVDESFDVIVETLMDRNALGRSQRTKPADYFADEWRECLSPWGKTHNWPLCS